MRIGVEITNNRLLLAAAEEDHFVLLEEHPFSTPATPEQLAEAMIEHLPSTPEDMVPIVFPAVWSLTRRRRLARALQEAGLLHFGLVPDFLAAAATLRHLTDLPENLDLIYLDASGTFSLLSFYAGQPSPLWEGSFTGDFKLLRKMANRFGYLYKSKWSEHTILCGEETLLGRLKASSAERHLPAFPLPATAALQGVTRYRDTLSRLLQQFCYRCHSQFYVRSSAGEKQPLFFAGDMLPLPWNDYHCLFFFTERERERWGFDGAVTWSVYEKNLPPEEDNNSLFSFSLTEPSALWLSASDGGMELLPFIENTPPVSFPTAPTSEAEVQTLLRQLAENLRQP